MEDPSSPTAEESFGAWAGGSIPHGSAKLDLLVRIVEHSPVPIFVKDPEGTYLYVNAAWVDIALVPKDAVVGRKDVDVFPDMSEEELRGDDRLALTAPGPFERTQRIQLRGQERVFRTVKFPIHDSAEEVIAVCGMSLEITDTLLEQKAVIEENERVIAAKPFERLLATLTPQEARVTELVVLGFSDKQIAETLHLTEGTVRHHVSHMLTKLRKRSRTQAVIALLHLRKGRK